MHRFFGVLLLFATCLAQCRAQGEAPASPAVPNADPDNRHIHATRFSIAPHQQLELPKLQHESVVVSFSSGRLARRPTVGAPESLDLIPGRSFAVRGSSADVLTNQGDAPIDLLVIELKDSYAFHQIAVPRSSRDPLEMDPQHVRLELENEDVRILRLTLKPRESSEESQFGMRLEIPLNDATEDEVLYDGKTTEKKLIAGTLQWRQTFRMSSLINEGESSLDLLIVEFKHPFCYPLPHSTIPDDTPENAKAYVARVQEKIRKNWYKHMPAEAREGEPGYVAVSFTILNDGSLSEEGVRLAAAFADELLVGKVISAIRDSSPFPPFPPELDKPDIRTGFTVLYNLSMNTTPGCP